MGRDTGSFKESGGAMDAQFCHVWKIADGKLRKFQQYVDTAALQHAMDAKAMA